MAQAQLMQVLKFDQADLAANRAGKFSPAPQERIVKQDKTKRLSYLVSGGIVTAVALASLIYAVVILFGTHDATSGLEFGIAFDLVVPLVFGLFGARSLWKALAPRQLRLPTVEGAATIKRTSSDSETLNANLVRVELQIGDGKFVVAPGLDRLIAQGGQCKIYYVAGADMILSVEELGKAG
jgi:hypothetical protein